MAAVTDFIPVHPPWLRLYQQAARLGRSRYAKGLSWCQTLPLTLRRSGGSYQVRCRGVNAHSAGEHAACSSSALPTEQTRSGHVLWWELGLCKWTRQGCSWWNYHANLNKEAGTGSSFLCQTAGTGTLPPGMSVCTSPRLSSSQGQEEPLPRDANSVAQRLSAAWCVSVMSSGNINV